MVLVKIKGHSKFCCNFSHILSLKDVDGNIKDISIRKYLRHWRKEDLKAFDIAGNIYDIDIKLRGIENYYGFQVDGNQRFCLNGGIVTHNSGKTTVFKEILLHILKVTEDRVGVISIEETPAETGRILSGMSLNRNFAFKNIEKEVYKEEFFKLFGDERIILLDHGGVLSGDISLLDKIEYMALKGCKYILFDHITIFAAEGADGSNDNSVMDSIMAKLALLVKKYPIWIGMISHLRKVPAGKQNFEAGKIPTIDDAKGSGSIKQIGYDVIGFSRDMESDDPVESNLTRVRILKCRFTGQTGEVKGWWYNFETGRLLHQDSMPNIEVFEVK
jgi:twinkle protein